MTRKELLDLMPKNSDDSEAAKAIVQLGYPMVNPVLRDMLLCLKVHNSPVADIFALFFAQISPQPVDLIAKHIGSSSGQLRNRILVDILPSWPKEAVLALSFNLTMLATHADLWNNDIECFRLVVKHALAEASWVKQWIQSRREQAVDRVRLFNELEMTIK